MSEGSVQIFFIGSKILDKDLVSFIVDEGEVTDKYFDKVMYLCHNPNLAMPIVIVWAGYVIPFE